MNKYLVTGGAGFIGSHIIKRLLSWSFGLGEDDQVICFDNMYTGREENISEFFADPRFKFIKGDITESYSVKHNPALKGVTHIFNCACPASPAHYQGKHAIDTTLTSVIGVKNMLDLATKNKATIMQFSTSEVYGDPEVDEQNEVYRGNVNCTGPRACYDEGKRCAESLCFDYNRIYGTKVKVIRIFNTYGPNMRSDDGRVVSNFICQALRDEDITIYGDGTQTRSFCYVDDLIDGIMSMMESPADFLGPVNLGNPFELSIKDIAELILDLLPHSKSSIVYKELPKDDPQQRKPDILLAKCMLGFEPKVRLTKGLILTIEYFKSEYDKERRTK
jgi:UDP-glucuronate decarboxylase